MVASCRSVVGSVRTTPSVPPVQTLSGDIATLRPLPGNVPTTWLLVASTATSWPPMHPDVHTRPKPNAGRPHVSWPVSIFATTRLVALCAGHRGVPIVANSVAVVDPATGDIVGSVRVGRSPGPILVAGGSVWVGNRGDLTVSRVDPGNWSTIRTFGLADTPEGLTASDGVVWITNGFSGTLSRILITYEQLSALFFPGGTVSGLVAAQATPTELWVGLSDNSLLTLDPASLRLKATFIVPGRTRAIAVDASGAWSIQFFDYDPKRAETGTGSVSTAVHFQSQPQAIALGAGAIWVATAGDDRLWKLDNLTGQIIGSVPLGAAPGTIAVTSSGIWVASASGGVLEQIDPKAATLQRTLRIGRPIAGVAADGNRVLVTVD
jgi:hypothetical protein